MHFSYLRMNYNHVNAMSPVPADMSDKLMSSTKKKKNNTLNWVDYYRYKIETYRPILFTILMKILQKLFLHPFQETCVGVHLQLTNPLSLLRNLKQFARSIFPARSHGETKRTY